MRSELESVGGRIPDGFTKALELFIAVFCSILGFSGVWRGVLGKAMCGIDRARRDLLGTSENRVGTSCGVNPRRKNSNLILEYPT